MSADRPSEARDGESEASPADALIAAFLAAEDAGGEPDREVLIAANPEQDEELRAFFREHDRLGRLAGPLRRAVQGEPTVDLAGQGRRDEEPVAPGDVVRYLGDYEILGELGRGGMGVVYRARQISLNRTVAIKMLRAGLLAGEDELRRFRNEAEAVALLDHPNVVPIYEVGQHGEHRYFAMKWVDGPSLDRCLEAFRGDPREAARLVADIAEAVHHAHQRGILHRDLKPSNVLLDRSSRHAPRADADGTRSVPATPPIPFVTDFGLAKRLTSEDVELTASGALVGTPAYMAPEQTRGRRAAITTATDVYGLGAILYALLTGRAPFRGESVAETLVQVRERAPERPTSVDRRVPRDLETICLKCLEKEPGRRYASAQALADDVRAWLAGRTIAARPAGAVERAYRWARRNPALATAGGIAAVGLLAFGVMSSLFALERDRAAGKQREAAVRLKGALDVSESHRREAQSAAARTIREQAMDRLRQNDPATSLLLLARALEQAPEDAELQHLLRQSLAVVAMNFPNAALRLEPDFPFTCAAFTPDGKTLLTGDHKGVVRHYDAGTGRLLRAIQAGSRAIDQLVPDPNNRGFATVINEAVRVWDQIPAFVDIIPRNTPLLSGIEEEGLKDVSFSNDGRRLRLLGWLRDGTERDWQYWMGVWDIRSGRPCGPLVFSGRSRSMSNVYGDYCFDPFSADGGTVLVMSDPGTLQVVDVNSGDPIGPPLRPGGEVDDFGFGGKGQMVLATSNGSLHGWNATSGERLREPLQDSEDLGQSGYFTDLAVTSDGRGVLVWGYGGRPRASSRELPSMRPLASLSLIWPIVDAFGSGHSPFYELGLADQWAFSFADGVEMWSPKNGQSIGGLMFESVSHPLSGRIYGASRPEVRNVTYSGNVCVDFTGPAIAITRTGDVATLGSLSALWRLEALHGDPELISLWVQVLTRSEQTSEGHAIRIGEGEWEARRCKLRGLIDEMQAPGIVQRVALDRLYWTRCAADEAQGSGRWRDAERSLARLADAEPSGWRHAQRLAIALVAQGRIEAAAQMWRRADGLANPDRFLYTPEEWLPSAVLMATDRNEIGLRRLTLSLIEELRKAPTNPRVNDGALRDRVEFAHVLLLGARPHDDLEFLLENLGKPVTRLEPGDRYDDSIAALRAAVMVRLGRHKDALDGWAIASPFTDGADKVPLAWPIFAIAHNHLGDTSAARRWLDRAKAKLAEIDAKPEPGDEWAEDQAMRLLTREAQELIEGIPLPDDVFAR